MVKSYYLRYGANHLDVDDLGKRIAQLLGMEAELRSSDYVGNYVQCLGAQADSLTVVPNEVGGEIVNKQFRQYSVLVEVSNTKGKSRDRETRTSAVKQALASMPELVLVQDI